MSLELGHGDCVKGLCILPNSDIIVSGCDDGHIRCWSTTSGSGECLTDIAGHAAPVWCVVPLSEGRVASSSFDGMVKIYESSSGQCLSTLTQHTDWVHVLLPLADGRLASAGHDGKLCVYDVDTGACLLECDEHTDEVHPASVRMPLWV